MRALKRELFAVLMLSVAAGCSRGVAWLDKRDLEQPIMQRAVARVAEGDADSAIRLYVKALEQDPAAARAHLDVALLMHDYSKDYVGAIYHYRRYLELRQDTEKRAMIEERIRLAKQLFAADVLSVGSGESRVAKLEKENRALQKQVDELSQRLLVLTQPAAQEAKRPKDQAATTRAPSRRSPQVKARSTISTYRVERGDTLSSIAAEVYGDSQRWRDIQAANTDILGNSDQVKVGQVLVIP